VLEAPTQVDQGGFFDGDGEGFDFHVRDIPLG
jgi:hypothetical protein